MQKDCSHHGIVNKGWSSITARSAHGVARASLGRLGNPAWRPGPWVYLLFFLFFVRLKPAADEIQADARLRGPGRSLEWCRHEYDFPEQNWVITKFNAICFTKSAGSKLYDLQESLFNLFSCYYPPAWPLSFRFTGIPRKGRVFSKKISGVGPSKNCVSIFFTRLLFFFWLISSMLTQKVDRDDRPGPGAKTPVYRSQNNSQPSSHLLYLTWLCTTNGPQRASRWYHWCWNSIFTKSDFFQDPGPWSVFQRDTLRTHFPARRRLIPDFNGFYFWKQ